MRGVDEVRAGNRSEMIARRSRLQSDADGVGEACSADPPFFGVRGFSLAKTTNLKEWRLSSG